MSGTRSQNDDDQMEILFEFRPIGQQVRVAALDAKTGTEVIIIAPASASQHDMQSVAAAKLMRKLAKDVSG